MPHLNKRSTQRLFGILTVSLVCLYIIITTSNLSFFNDLGPYNEKRFLQVTLLIFLAVCTATLFRHSIHTVVNRFPGTVKILLLPLFLIGILSSINTNNPLLSITETGQFALLFITCLAIAAAYIAAPNACQKIILFSIVTLALIQTTSVLTAYTAAMASSVDWHSHDLFLGFSNIRFFNQLQSWTLPLIVLPLILYTQKNKRLFIGILFISACWWLLLLISGSRGTMLAMAIAIIASLAIYQKHAITWIRLQLIAAAIGFALYLLLFYIIPFMLAVEINDTSITRLSSVNARFYLWERSWFFIQQNPFLGIGPMHYACDPQNLIAAHPHNSIFQIAAEWGLPAAFITLFIFLYGLYCWIKGNNQSQPTEEATKSLNIRIALFASLIAGTTHSLFSGVIVMPVSQTMMILVIGWMIGIHFSSRPQRKESNITSTLFPAIVIISISFLVIGIHQNPPPQETMKVQNLTASKFIPRFWQQGKTCAFEELSSKTTL
ncbi:MAG: hypothetical protein COB71_01545 [Thiotrichales bacterium]|nr:MAG: hypothetical protein COB71_01545 [Thiotrichales bacterium]